MNGREEHNLKIEKFIRSKLTELPDFVSDWHETLKNKGMQVSTRQNYVLRIAKYCKSMNIKEASDITYTNVTRFINKNSYKENDPAKETSGAHRQALWSAMKNFLVYLHDGGLIENVIKISIDGKVKLGGNERPKGDNEDELKNRRIIITEDEFNEILSAVDNEPNDIKAARDRAILVLFMTTGMRREALIDLNIEDVDFVNSEISYIDKRERYFTRSMDDIMIKYLNEWLKVRDVYAERGNDTNALFISNRGNRIARDLPYLIVKKYSKIALGYEISPHKLRSGFITIMYNHTHDIELVRRIIHHSNVETTQRYIRIKEDNLEKTRGDILKGIFE